MAAITTPELVQLLWLKHNGDTKALLKELGSGIETDVMSEENIKKLEAFNKQFNCLTIGENDTIFNRMVPVNAELRNEFPVALIRWNKSYPGDLIKDNQYTKTIFVIDGDIRKYKIPDGYHAIGYYTERNTEGTDIYIINEQGQMILKTQSWNELFHLGLALCRHLLIVPNKGAEIKRAPILFDISAVYLDEKRLCMAVPGKAGCYSNELLKAQPVKVRFVDTWGDITQWIDIYNRENK